MNYSNTAKSRRLRRLQKNGYYQIFALDHGLTSGVASELIEINDWLKFSAKNNIASFVTSKGVAQLIQENSATSLILQTIGTPQILDTHSTKVQVASIHEAVRLGADAIAVRLDFQQDKELPERVAEMSKLIEQAHNYSYPVLLMAGNIIYSGKNDMRILLDIIRYSTELGADIIKVNLPKNKLSKENLKLLSDVVRNSPPIVIAGGGKTAEFIKTLELAKSVGFSGVCIGRNIFTASKPTDVLEQINAVFGDNKK